MVEEQDKRQWRTLVVVTEEKVVVAYFFGSLSAAEIAAIELAGVDSEEEQSNVHWSVHDGRLPAKVPLAASL